MAGTTNCRTCGQANASDSEYCVRCGERMPDPSSTQLVSPPVQGGAAPEYPWEPPAEWDPGELPVTGGQPPAPTWVGRNPDQAAWNTGQDAAPPGQPYTPQSGQPYAPQTPQPGYPPQSGYPSQPGYQSQPGYGSQPSYPGQTPPPGFAPRPGQGKSGGSKKPIFIGAGAIVVVAAIVLGIVLATGGSKKKTDNGGGGGGKTTVATNGVEKESGSDALTSARVALRDAKSAHLAGTVQSSGQAIQLDLTLAGNDAEGTLTINNNDVTLIKTGGSVFIKGDPDFLKQYAGGNTAAVSALNGKWLKTATTSDFDSFSLDGFANELKGGTGSATVDSKVTTSTLNGKPVAIISQSDGSTLTVADTGTPFPLMLSSKGTDGGQITFSDYNKAVTIAAPEATQVVDVAAIGRYTCKPKAGSTGGGVLTLNVDNSYTLSNGKGGFWGSSGNQVAFSGGDIDKFTATEDASSTTLTLIGTGTNAGVSYTCPKG